MLVDQLGMPVAPKQDAEIVEPSHEPLQFYPVDEKNRDRRLGLSHVIEKRVLEVLRLLGCHSVFPFVGPFWPELFDRPPRLSDAPFFQVHTIENKASEHISRNYDVKEAL